MVIQLEHLKVMFYFVKHTEVLGNQKVSGTSTASDLTVTGNLLIGTTNVLTTLKVKANTSALTGLAPF